MATTPPTPADINSWRKRFKEGTTRAKEVLCERRVGLSWSGIIIGGLGAGVALWPLARAAWDLLGLTTGQTWRLGVLGVCALVLAAGVAGANWVRTSPVRLVWLILTAWLVAAGAVAALTALAWLVLGAPDWQQLEDLTPNRLDAITTRAFAIVAGLGGVALLVIAYRRQRTTEADAVRAEAAKVRAELAADREVAKLFTDNFDSASSKLGEEHAAVRLAGVHALARLADEAPEGRDDLVQMVIDVLCAYLRMPYIPRPDAPAEPPGLLTAISAAAVDLGRLRGTEHDEEQRVTQEEEHRKRVLEFESFQQVRHTIIRIIGNRLREDTRWRDKDLDFTSVVFDGGDFSSAQFSGGKVSFRGARFTGGSVVFSRARFSGGTVDFSGAEFSGGSVVFSRARFSGGTVDFSRTRFSGGTVLVSRAEFTSGKVDFSRAEFTSGKVDFSKARFAGGTIDFREARFTGGTIDFSKARLIGGTVVFSGARFTGGRVSLNRAEFSSGKASFRGARFSGGTVSYSGAEFSGGTVVFSRARFAGRMVVFSRARFTGGTVLFSEAEFSGGRVAFSEAEFTSGKVDFSRTSGDCPEHLLQAIGRGNPGMVSLPDQWRTNPAEDGEGLTPESRPDTSGH